MRPGGGHLQSRAFRGGNQFAACPVHFDAQVADAIANACASFHDGLVQLGLDLFGNVRRSLGNELGDVRAQIARRRVNNLKLFLDADGEAVSHELALRSGTSTFPGTMRLVSYRATVDNGTWLPDEVESHHAFVFNRCLPRTSPEINYDSQRYDAGHEAQVWHRAAA